MKLLVLASIAVIISIPAQAQEIGVESCDLFLSMYQKCVIDQMPSEMRPPYDSTMIEWRKQWTEMAGDANNELILTGICNQLAEQTFPQGEAGGCGN